MDTIAKILSAIIILLLLIGGCLAGSYKYNTWPYSDKKTDKENKNLASTISIVLGILLIVSGGYLIYHMTT